MEYYENHPQSSFNDFSGFLTNSLISPMVYAPFREQDKRCFATMENITGYLTQLSEKENDNPLVSIIMPVYNRVDIVESAINSVFEQTYSNIELIIIDDGSDDGSKELLDLIEYYLLNEDERCSKIEELQKFVLENHTYINRAEFMKDKLKKYIYDLFK